jgi:hypothetical protein
MAFRNGCRGFGVGKADEVPRRFTKRSYLLNTPR